MRIDLPTLELPEKLATVVIDSTRITADGDQQVANRWQELRHSLSAQGASESVLDHLQSRVLKPTGASGQHGRVLLAGAGGVIADRLLHQPADRDDAVYAQGPELFALARAADSGVRYLIVSVDRTGADLDFVDTALPGSERESIDGDHDEITKNRTGGLSHRRIQARAEDSWERNAEQVAGEVDSAATQFQPEVVFLTGDVRMVTLVQENASGQSTGLLHALSGGSRSEDSGDDSFAADVEAALEQVRLRRRQEVLDRYQEASGQDRGAVSGLGNVLDALRRGQVEELLVTPDAVGQSSGLRTQTLWHGTEPLEIGEDRDELDGMGVADPEEGPADVVLGIAAWGSGAGITFVDEASGELADGIGALLRWDDEATPGQSAYTLSSDSERANS